MKTILFVCTGNTCRSPMAEGILRELLKDDKQFEVYSAGINAFPGMKAMNEAIDAAKKYGIDISNHSSKRLSKELIDKATLILTMTQSQKNYIINADPFAKDKTYTLNEFIKGIDQDIEDPYGQDIDEYNKCLKEINELLMELKEKIINK